MKRFILNIENSNMFFGSFQSCVNVIYVSISVKHQQKQILNKKSKKSFAQITTRLQQKKQFNLSGTTKCQ